MAKRVPKFTNNEANGPKMEPEWPQMEPKGLQNWCKNTLKIDAKIDTEKTSKNYAEMHQKIH